MSSLLELFDVFLSLQHTGHIFASIDNVCLFGSVKFAPETEHGFTVQPDNVVSRLFPVADKHPFSRVCLDPPL
jgi:hypothetical protein